MNNENLHEIINRYEQNYEKINSSSHDEKFKWGAVKGFRDVWFSDKAANMPFSELFAAATKRSSILINNSMISPTSGIVKMAEKRPEEVESLFRNLLFSDYSSVAELQDHMDNFLERIEKVRQELFPQFYRYKQERHAASCYLAFFAPEEHFIYRYSDAEEFANYVEFGKDLGAGSYFSLPNYYELAELLVDAIKQHPSLIEKYDMLFKDNDHYYYDKSLHLMAFDIMYCSRCYNFYSGMQHARKKENIKAFTAQQVKEHEEALRLQKRIELEERIHSIDVQIGPYAEISLIGVQVYQKSYGTGNIIAQNGSTVKVKFPQKITSYHINKQFTMRPTFENDDLIVDAFTDYDRLVKEKMLLESELSKL